MLNHGEIIISSDSRVLLPANHYETVIEHCRRKLAGNYLAGESCERKAFGLVGGKRDGENLIVEKCFPLLKNARQLSPYSNVMDSAMAQYAVPSETPLSKRGWIAEPEELLGHIKSMQQDNLLLLGAYHMHRVAWPDDPLRETPTVLDTVLAAESKMIIFIISMVNPDQPVMRAFYEGKPDNEVQVLIKNFAKE